MRSNRTSVNVNDYPEHLNPFHEEDNHARLRFWSITRKSNRSNSFSFQSIKDFKSTLGRSFSIRGKNKNSSSSEQLPVTNDDVTNISPSQRQTISPDGRYVHQGSRTPLPRTRFHERVKHLEPEQSQPVPVKAVNAESPPLEDNNPFNDDYELDRSSTPSPSRPQTLPRKKKRAPPPPPVRQSLGQPAPVDTTNTTSEDKKAEVIVEQTKVEIPAIEITEVTSSTDNSKQVSDDRIVSNVSCEDSTDVSEEKVQVDNEQVATELKKETVNNCEEKSEAASEEKSEDINEEKSNASSEEKSITTNEQKSEADSEEKSEDTCIEQSEDTSIEQSEDTSIEQSEETSTEVSEENKKCEDSTEEKPVDNTDIAADELQASCNDTTDNNSNKSSEDTAIELSEDNSSASESIPETNDLNFNSEITISSSDISVISAEQLEERQQQLAIDDTSDLMAMVQKLHMEVQKLTDDTNNNSIQSSHSSDKEQRYNEHYQSLPCSPTKVRTEMNVRLNSDSDVLTNSNSPSPRIRIRNDSAWIREAK